MKLFYFFTTFVLVNVTAENDETAYKMEVFLANKSIELAYYKNDLTVGDNSGANGLEYVIEKMVNNTPHHTENYECFAKINFLIAVPDKLDIIFHIPEFEILEPITRCIIHQNIMQHEIKKTLYITIPKVEIDQDIEGLNLTTLAEERRSFVKPALKNIFKRLLGSMYNQFIMQLEIRDILTNKVQDLNGLNLTTLAEVSRVTGTSLENIIRRRVLGTDIPNIVEDQNLVGTNSTTLAEERRVTGTSLGNTIRGALGTDISEVVEDQNGSEHDDSFVRLCRLMGLYMSIQFPESYIKKLWIDPDCCTCTLDDGITQKIYHIINGVLWL